MRARMTKCWAAVVVAMVLLAACGGTRAADKAGNDTVVLRMGTADSVNDNGQSYGPQAFIDSLDKVSGGRLKVEMTDAYTDSAADAESNIVKAIASGDLDGGWPATRAFANAGITGLQAVEAPMTITSYAAEKALVTAPVAADLLKQLDGSGVVGLGLAVGPLRRPFASRSALLGPADWQGAQFRAFNSPVQADAIRAIGATPVNMGGNWNDAVAAGNLRGAEFDIAQYAANGGGAAGYVTGNVVLWPKVLVLSLSRKRFDALSHQQQGWVRKAGELAVQASVDATYDETTPARQLCTAGIRFFDASTDQLAALRTSVAPVIAALAADAESGPMLKQIQTIAAQNPGPDAPDVPASCRQPVSETAGGPQDIPEQVSALPDGQYRVEITAEDVAAAGESNSDGPSGIWTLKVQDGTFEVFCHPVTNVPGHDCGNAVSDKPFTAGQVRGTGSTVYFVFDQELTARLDGCLLPVSESDPTHCGPNATFWLNWKMDGDSVQFTNSQPFEDLTFTLKPWRKIT